MISALWLLAEEAPAADEPSPLLPHTAELIVGFVAFTLLFLLLRAKVFPLFEKAYAERTEAIQGGLAKAEKAQLEAAQMLASYQAELADARGEAARIREDARAEAATIGEQLREQARQDAADIVARATTQMEAERASTVAALRREVGELAVTLAGKIVGQALEDDARQRALVDEFIASLDQPADQQQGA